ncbi:MAG: glycosyltransferase [Nitrospiraceae bacterium]
MLFVGTTSAEKGIEVFLDALPLLRAQSWRAVVIGEGPLRAPAKQRVVQEGLADRVRLPEWLSGPIWIVV